ncbi:MAG: [Fe-Fe] hydrogenase large subunit C-terminal domain-containing protein [Bacteroidota bacterium]
MNDPQSVSHEPGQVIWVEPGPCILCYACVRECPVRAIEVKANVDHVRILPNRCIACGSCYTICPTRAVRISSDYPAVVKALESGASCYAIVDPSISAEFPDISDYRNFVGMIRELGFKGVYDMSFGVDLSAQIHADLFTDFRGKYRISSKCPAVISMVRKYYPELTDNLVPVLTPAGIIAQIIRAEHPGDCTIVQINPCLASRLELNQKPDESRIDSQINYPELRELFELKKITESSVEFSEFDPPLGRSGAMFPLSAGLLQAVGKFENLLESNFLSTEGQQNILASLEEFATTYDIRKHLDLFYCEGCIMGPGMSPHGHKFRRRTLVTEYARKMTSAHGIDLWEKEVSLFDPAGFQRTFEPDDQHLPEPDESEINDILKLIGKTGDIDIDRGCMACGYKTCKDFAVSVAQGLAKAEMCHLYGTKNRQEYIRSLKSSNDQLAKAQKALLESEKQALEEKEMVREYSETLSSLLQKIPSGVVLVNKDMRIIQSNRAFIDILGDEAKTIDEVIPGLKGADMRTLLPPQMFNLFTHVLQNNLEVLHRDIQMENRLLSLSVFPIKKGNTLGAILRDLSLPEVQKEEVIKKVTEVIDKNLEMVQQIGFLLGEGAADTEKMLNSIIKYYRSEE